MGRLYTSSGVKSSLKAVRLAASVGNVLEGLEVVGASSVAAFVLIEIPRSCNT